MSMNTENAKAQMRKGVLEYCILLLLGKEDYYASDILKRLKAAQLLVVEGTLYPLLTRQKNLGLLSYRWEESKQGPPRKYYKITEKGVAALAEMDAAWNELLSTVDLIKNNSNRLKLMAETQIIDESNLEISDEESI